MVTSLLKNPNTFIVDNSLILSATLMFVRLYRITIASNSDIIVNTVITFVSELVMVSTCMMTLVFCDTALIPFDAMNFAVTFSTFVLDLSLSAMK